MASRSRSYHGCRRPRDIGDKQRGKSMRYNTIYRRSIDDPTGFWSEAAEEIDWSKPFNEVIDTSHSPFNVWFPGGELNTCFNALDRHIAAGRGEQVALIHDSPVTGSVTKFTYDEMLDRVARLAGGLKARGVGKGDRVVIYMPAVPEAVIGMLEQFPPDVNLFVHGGFPSCSKSDSVF